MKRIYQNKLHEIVCDMMEAEAGGPEFDLYKHTVGLIYTLLENNELERLDIVLRLHFPNYYNSPALSILLDN